MAPSPTHIWVICEATGSKNINPVEAHTTSAAALQAASSFESIVEVKQIPLKDGDAGAKAKTPRKAAKRARTDVEDDDEEDELAAGEHTTPNSAEAVTPGEGGIPNVLEGLTILFTGTMDKPRKTCEATAKSYGATMAKKIEDADYVVLGTRPGPNKLTEIEKHGLDTLSEAEFFEMLHTGVPREKRDSVAAKAAAAQAEPVDSGEASSKKKSKK